MPGLFKHIMQFVNAKRLAPAASASRLAPAALGAPPPDGFQPLPAQGVEESVSSAPVFSPDLGYRSGTGAMPFPDRYPRGEGEVSTLSLTRVV